MATFDYDQLEALLLSKTYAALTFKERDWVHQFMTETEYEAQRMVLLHAITFPPPPSIVPSGDLGALQQLHQERYNAPSSFWTWTFTLWQTALLAVLSGVIVYWCCPQNVPVEITKEVFVHQVDTLWQEKIIYQPQIIYQTKRVQLPPQVDTVFIEVVTPLDSFFMQEQRAIVPLIPPKRENL